jgi:hypothetical protein
MRRFFPIGHRHLSSAGAWLPFAPAAFSASLSPARPLGWGRNCGNAPARFLG